MNGFAEGMRQRRRLRWWLLALLLLGANACRGEAGTDFAALARDFAKPPSSSMPWVYWFWMNGNVTREGITADLEAMQRAGIAGALIMEVGDTKRGQMAPPGPVKFASPEWVDCFRHAVAEAGRLGLAISMNNDAGWCGSGGPWNTAEHSMQRLTWSDTPVTGPGRWEGVLPQPRSKQGFYRDIKILAYPATDGPAVARERVLDLSGQADASGRLTWEVPPGKWMLRRIGHTSTGRTNHPAPPGGLGLECDKFSAGAVRRHFDGLIGRLADAAGPACGKTFAMTHIDSWEVGEQDWTGNMPEEFRRRRGYDLTPWLVPLTEGPDLDDEEMTRRFRRDFKRTQSELLCENYAAAMRKLANGRGLRLSIEAYGPDGGFLNPLDYGAEADLPMAEFWVRRWDAWHLASPRLLASVAHVTGKAVAGAEGFTASPQQGNWNDHPYTIKALGDWIFCEGINRLVLHRMVHQPWAGLEPGMTFGPFGTHFDRNQTWWEPGAAFMKYLARCQHLLQQGTFVADVCRLVPDGEDYGARSSMAKLPGRYAEVPAGYNYDYVPDQALEGPVRVEKGRMVLASGMSYAVLQLPESGEMPPQVLRRLREWVAAGATVAGPRPTKSPGLQDYPACDGEVRKLAAELWGACDGQAVTEHRWGAGRVVWGKPLPAVLREAGLAPDLSFAAEPPLTPESLAPDLGGPRRRPRADSAPQMPTAGLNWIHRRLGEADLYFLANPQHREVRASCRFRVKGRRPEIWDPETGGREPCALWLDEAEGTCVPLRFSPAGSWFVLFREPGEPAPQVTALERDGKRLFGSGDGDGAPEALPRLGCEAGQIYVQTETAGTYRGQLAGGRTVSGTLAAPEASLPLPGPWEVRFQPGRGAPDALLFPALLDWSGHAGEGIRDFSGTASYRGGFEMPPEAGGKGENRYLLDLGRVEVMAEVSLNGNDLGVLWKPPFVRDVTEALREGSNELVVKVTNLWANRLIAEERYPDDCTAEGKWKTGALPDWPEWFLRGQARPEPRRLAFTTWKYYPADAPKLPSGWLGPACLRVEKRVMLK